MKILGKEIINNLILPYFQLVWMIANSKQPALHIMRKAGKKEERGEVSYLLPNRML